MAMTVAGLASLMSAGTCHTDWPGQFTEYLFRPLVTAFRVALDRYDLVIDTDPERLAAELSPAHLPTGRVVVTQIAGVTGSPDAAADRATVQHAARGLGRCLESLAVAIGRLRQPGQERAGQEQAGQERAAQRAHQAARRIMAEELRFLAPHTVRVLRGDHPPGRYAHGISPEQDLILRKVINAVEERAQAARTDQALLPPAVMLDLDLTALDPRRRILHAAREVSGPRPGAPRGIAELASPERLTVLPTYPIEAWRSFLRVSGLRETYPDVDFGKLHEEYTSAFFRPWSNLAWDTLVPGVVQFVRDVEDRGGSVIFGSGRRERVRPQTEEVLARAGLLRPRLLLMPDDRTRPIAELKAEMLRDITDVHVVAVIDDLADNLRTLSSAFPAASAVAVALPGLAEPESWNGPVIATFERHPSPPGPGYGCALSHTNSVAELHVGELNTRPVAAGHAVHLSAEQSSAIVNSLVARADQSARQTASQALERLGELKAAIDDAMDTTVLLVHHLLGRKQFRRGSRATYPVATAARDMLPFIGRGESIRVVLPSFPIKEGRSGLKSFGALPDLAELALLVRLRELQMAVRDVYEPGLRITLLTDGQHFRPRPAALTDAYARKLKEYVHLVGGDEFLEVEDLDEMAARQLGTGATRRRAALAAAHERDLWQAFAGLDIASDPHWALARSRILDPAGPNAPGITIADLFTSIVYSVDVPAPHGADRREWSKRIYADLYNVTDPAVPGQLMADRRTVLRNAWAGTIRYVAGTRADEALDYEHIITPRVRLSINSPVRGRCGFAGLGGSALLPWHGTGTVDSRGNISTDFAISLLDQGFVPVYSPLLGPGQPWLMAPVTATWVPDRGRPAELTREFLTSLRLRRR